MENSIVKQEQATPDQLLQMAVDKNLDVDKLEKLVDLKLRVEAEQARKDFFASLAHFQNTCPEIVKNKSADFGAGKAKYQYAPLPEIARTIKDPVKESGLTYRWEIKDEGEMINVTCIVTHVSGHSERTTMSSKSDTTGNKNPIQAKGSAIEYMKRYTLIGALGISTADSDLDGLMPEIHLEILHKQYMEHLSELIQIDKKYTSWSPDNWKQEPNAKLYAKAIAEIRVKLKQLKG